LLKDSIVVLVLFIVLVFLATLRPAPLGPQADPTSDFLARPAWYFLPLFQLLKYFPGRFSLIPTVLLPGVLFALIFLLPFLDRRPERHPLKRPLATASLLLILSGSAGLITLSKHQDKINPEFTSKLRLQAEEAKAFFQSPFQPQEIGRSIAVTPPAIIHPAETGSVPLKIFFANCANCHGADATGGPLGPSLVKLAKRRTMTVDSLVTWIAGHAREPSADSMPRYNQLAIEERKELAEWLLNLNEPVARMEKATPSVRNGEPPSAFAAACAFCHGARAEGNIAPSLIGITAKPNRSKDDLLRLLNNSRTYGLKDPMPASFPALSGEDKRKIVEWLARLSAK